jgi:hypothetical protein
MRSWLTVIDTSYGVSAYIGKFGTAGETDRQVATASFGAVLHRDPSDNELLRLNAQYLLHLADNVVVPWDYRTLPAEEKILLRLQRPG